MIEQIPGDYQYRALTEKIYIQRNWHESKLLLLEHIKLPPIQSVADVGCGSGNLLYRFKDRYKRIVGFDNNPAAIAFINSKIKKLKATSLAAQLVDITSTKNPIQEKFDLVVCMEVLEHFDITVSRDTVLPFIKKLLKPQGLLLLTTPNNRSAWPVIEYLLDYFHLTPHMHGEQHLCSFDRPMMKNALEKNAFSIVTMGTFNHISPYMPIPFLHTALLGLEIRYGTDFGPILYAVARLDSRV